MDILLATDADFQAHVEAGLTPTEIAALYAIPVTRLMSMDFFRSAKRDKRFRAKPSVAYGKPVSILSLTRFHCAVVVESDEPLPHYCGAPATRNYRMCEGHARTMLQGDTK